MLSYPEGRAALAGARRARRLTAAAHRCALQDFEATYSELVTLGIDIALARRAGGLA